MSEAMQADFDKAAQYTFDDRDIERAKLLLGVDLANRRRELFSVATADAIRNWSLGMGDDNPLYTEEDYGPDTRWGSQIAPGPMAGHVKTAMYGDPMPEEVMLLTDLELKMVNQRDTETAYGKATVSLPSRGAGAALLANVPAELARRAARMFARHNEIAAERRGKKSATREED